MISPRLRQRRLAAALVVMIMAALAFILRFEQQDRHATGDTYWYLLQAQQLAGTPGNSAEQAAAQLLCTDLHYGITLTGSSRSQTCSQYRGIKSPRYRAIFSSRPLWPLVLAPAVRLLGPIRGIVFVTGLGAVLAALAVYFAVLVLGVSPWAAGAAGCLFSLLPTGYWSAKLLPEGAVLATLAVALYGAARVARGDLKHLAVLATGMVALYALKPGNGVALAVGMLAAGLVLLPRRVGRQSALALVGIGAAGILGWLAVSKLLQLPSLDDTLQDLATKHFRHADVPDPQMILLHMNYGLWRHERGPWLPVPWPFAIVIPAAVITVLALRRAGLVVAIGALAGAIIVVTHPVVSEYDRLVSSVWLVVPAAGAVLIDLTAAQAPALRLARARALGRWPCSGVDRQQAVIRKLRHLFRS